MTEDMTEQFEDILRKDLHQFLLSMKEVDERLPIGMAVAKMWDTEWEIYSKVDDLYTYMRDKRDYDHLDEYIREKDGLSHD